MSGPQLDIDSIEARMQQGHGIDSTDAFVLCDEVRQLRQALAAVEKVRDEWLAWTPDTSGHVAGVRLATALGAAVTPTPQDDEPVVWRLNITEEGKRALAAASGAPDAAPSGLQRATEQQQRLSDVIDGDLAHHSADNDHSIVERNGVWECEQCGPIL